jgi:hypothetical protein
MANHLSGDTWAYGSAGPGESRSRTRKSRLSRIALIGAFVLLIAPTALAAELATTAELEGTGTTVVEVEQGSSADFDIRLSATGAIKCTISSADPATARVHTSFALDADGNLSSGALSAPHAFYSNGVQQGASANCGVTWTGASTPYTVGASVSANAATLPGDYALILSSAAGTTQTSNPDSPGLDDDIATNITIRVLEASGGCENEYTATFLRPIDQSDEHGEIANAIKNGRVVPVKVTLWDDCADEAITGARDNITIKVSQARLSNPTSDPVEEFASAGSANTDSLFRWSDDGFYIYNLGTKTLGLNVGKYYEVDVKVGGYSATENQWAVLSVVK